jgi:guanidinoacetate N-methyltransferase
MGEATCHVVRDDTREARLDDVVKINRIIKIDLLLLQARLAAIGRKLVKQHEPSNPPLDRHLDGAMRSTLVPSVNTVLGPTYADLRAEWSEAEASFERRGHTECLRILGAPVMEDWEAPYMAALAAVACKNGGRVLEVGFGLGLSAEQIDLYNSTAAAGGVPLVTEHFIIEANAEVAGAARLFAETAAVKTIVYEGFWQDVVEELLSVSAAPSTSTAAGAGTDNLFDGILFDVFPLTRDEVVDGECDSFYPAAARLLRSGGVFTYYFDVVKSWIHCKRIFRGESTRKLYTAGFTRVEEDECMCQPPPDCEYFWKDRFIVPIVTK